MQLDEGDFAVVPLEDKEQILDAAKGGNPDNAIWMHDRIISEKGDGACVVNKRVGRIWKGLFPLGCSEKHPSYPQRVNNAVINRCQPVV